MTDFPDTSISELRRLFYLIGLQMGNTYIQRIFQKWKWSWKKPFRRHVLKYTEANIRVYMNFIAWLATQYDWTRIKYMDESSFCAQSNLKS
jgi:hypothetical protein